MRMLQLVMPSNMLLYLSLDKKVVGKFWTRITFCNRLHFIVFYDVEIFYILLKLKVEIFFHLNNITWHDWCRNIYEFRNYSEKSKNWQNSFRNNRQIILPKKQIQIHYFEQIILWKGSKITIYHLNGTRPSVKMISRYSKNAKRHFLCW